MTHLYLETDELQAVRMKTAPLHGVVLAAPNGCRLESLRVSGRLQPGRRSDLRVSVALHPHTPAGRYEGLLELGGRAVPVSIVVPEERAVRLSPPRLELSGKPGEVRELLMIIENLGNVPVPLLRPEPIWIQPAERLHTMLRKALQEMPAPQYEIFLNTLLAKAKETVTTDLSRFMGVTLKNAPDAVLPGQTVVVTLRFRVPRAVGRGGRFGGRVELAGQRVRVDLVCPRGPVEMVRKKGKAGSANPARPGTTERKA